MLETSPSPAASGGAARTPAPNATAGRAAVASGAVCALAFAWLVSRVFVGLDFTDEMQYYGEIASLTRTGHFFQVDLFIQQLGYFFVWPLFKLHAAIFPDQSFLLLFGRVVLLAGYAAVGALVWRTAGKLGFARAEKLAGVAVFAAWVPFQIFALSYNTMAYLLVVAIAAVWLDAAESPAPHRPPLALAALLAILIFVYPPIGVALAMAGGVETALRRGFPAALALALFVVGVGAVILGALVAWHGTGFTTDLLAAVEFSRTFVGGLTRLPGQIVSWSALLVATAVFIRRIQLGRPFSHPFQHGGAPFARGAILAGLIAGNAVLVALTLRWTAGLQRWTIGYLTTSIYIAMLMLIAGAADSQHASSAAFARRLPGLVLAGGALALLAMSVVWDTGFFAITIFMVVLILLAAVATSGTSQRTVDLAIVGTLLGSVVAYASGNGLHNFGLGAAGVIPFLALYLARDFRGSHRFELPAFARTAVAPALALLLIINGAWFPYRERPFWNRFHLIEGVPAFRGIATSKLKLEALQLIERAGDHGAMKGKRVLVAGPHPWIYFAWSARPATSMFFMHFSGTPATYELAATRCFVTGEPDAILVTNPVPSPIQSRILAWAKPGCTAQTIPLPSAFQRGYEQMVLEEFSPELLLLRREPAVK